MLITEESLKETTGYKQRTQLMDYLISKGIHFEQGRDKRVWTTLEWVSRIAKDTDEVEFI